MFVLIEENGAGVPYYFSFIIEVNNRDIKASKLKEIKVMGDSDLDTELGLVNMKLAVEDTPYEDNVSLIVKNEALGIETFQLIYNKKKKYFTQTDFTEITVSDDFDYLKLLYELN